MRSEYIIYMKVRSEYIIYMKVRSEYTHLQGEVRVRHLQKGEVRVHTTTR